MKEWLEKYYGSKAFRSTLIAAFSPLFLRYAREITGATEQDGGFARDFAESLAAGYVDHHLDSSRAQLQSVLDAAEKGHELASIASRLDEWAESRAAKVAANETLRAANAVALQQFRDAGVERKVWAASGNACPFCASLDGATVEVDRPFVEAGDSLNPQGAETPMTFTSSLGHPPIHQGCDCSVVAG